MKQKNYYRIVFSEKNPVIIFLFFSSIFFATNVFSAAGDAISSTATIDYSLGGIINSTQATAVFIEDRRINFIVSDNSGAAVPVVSDMSNAVLQFSVTNLGNTAQDFLLTAVNTSPNPFSLPADNFDPLAGSMQVFVENGFNAGYQLLEDTMLFVDELQANNTRVVYVVADIPTLIINDVAAVALITQVAEGGAAGVEGAAINADQNGRTSPAGIFSNGSTSVAAGIPAADPDSVLSMETVFNDPAGLNPEDLSTDLNLDIAGNGQHSDASAYQVLSPVNILKTVTVIDTLGGSDPHPGATLRYQLNVTVAGNTAVDNLVISDLIPVNTSYNDGSLLLNALAQTDADDAPVDYSRAIDILSKPVTAIEVDLSQGGTLPVNPGENNVIIFEVTID